MTVVISSSLVLSDSVSGGGVINSNNPIIGYDNLVTSSNISATTEDADNPASNMANPATHLKWLAAGGSPSVDEYITLDLQTAELVDYVGIAKHNFGTAQMTVSLEALDDGSPTNWTELISEFIPADDQPILMRFTPQGVTQLRIKLQPGNAEPQAAVVYAGTLLVLQRRIFVGHTPINYGRKLEFANHRSINGNFLGRILLNEKKMTSVQLTNLTQTWYRTYFEPFMLVARESPFFFAWRPNAYPYEIGYCWLTNDPQPDNQSPNGFMQVSFDIEGIS